MTVHGADQCAVERTLSLLLHLSDAERVRTDIVQCLFGIRISDCIRCALLDFMKEQFIELSAGPFDLTCIGRERVKVVASIRLVRCAALGMAPNSYLARRRAVGSDAAYVWMPQTSGVSPESARLGRAEIGPHPTPSGGQDSAASLPGSIWQVIG